MLVARILRLLELQGTPYAFNKQPTHVRQLAIFAFKPKQPELDALNSTCVPPTLKILDQLQKLDVVVPKVGDEQFWYITVTGSDALKQLQTRTIVEYQLPTLGYTATFFEGVDVVS